MMNMIGHNQGPALVPPQAVLPDDHKKLFHFVKWHLADYITGTQGMTIEQEGIYMRFLSRLYDRGKPFPDDDRFMVTVLGLSTVRVWKRLKDSLISIGKIIVRNGFLTNARFEREKEKRAAELQKQADAAKMRWQREKHLAEVSAKLEANLAQTLPKLSESDPKKVNEINETPVTTHMPLKRPETRDLDREERKKEDTQPPPVQEAVVVANEISGLNGATSVIIDKLAGWINPLMPDRRTARDSLANMVGMYGSDIVRDAFAKLEAKKLNGDIIARPIPFFADECGRIAARRKADLKSKPKTYRKPNPWD